ncbi:MAG: aminopeptidase, partial [bacterium]|nr:aminopeptidase [bacterium]
EKGDRLLIKSTTLAEPLVREVYREALKKGAIVEVDLDFEDQGEILLNNGQEEALKAVPVLFEKAINEFDAYLNIRAPFTLRQAKLNKDNAAIRQNTMKPIFQTYFDRTADRRLKRSLCQYPTWAAAREAGMNLKEYSNFVFSACKLFEEDPKAAWIQLRQNQQAIVDKLNSCTEIRYFSPHMDISFSTEGRTWINSDGQTN